MTEIKKSPFALRNIKLFICLRVFFNSRFYYPVFTIMFLDYGLTIEQFAFLNAIWAITIVLSEVPSGALADMLGRKTLLIFTAIGMILEMMVIAFVPLGNGSLIFYAFFMNRIFSGLAEAMASGADEALAYDTLKKHGLEKEWGRVLDIQLRIQSAGYIVVMTLGGLIYDPESLRYLGNFFGIQINLSQQVTMRFPIYMTLVFAFFALATALLMQGQNRQRRTDSLRVSLLQVNQVILKAARWTLKSPLVLVIILVGTSFDHIMRMIVTLNSQYFRTIGLPEASFGFIGSMIAVVGMFVPRGARYMAEHWTPQTNVIVMAIISIIALLGLPLLLPYCGILFMVFIFMVMMMNSYFMSHYLNQITHSDIRATVLSFKGLVFNIAYGGIGLVYGALFSAKKNVSSDAVSVLFQQSLSWFPVYFFLLFIVLFFVARKLGKGVDFRSLVIAKK